MSKEQLKKKLESEREEYIKQFDKWSHHDNLLKNEYLTGSKDMENRLLPLFEKAVDEIKCIKRHSKYCSECGAHDIAEDFLSEFTKMTEIKKESV